MVNSIIISNDLTQMVNFLTQVPDCDSHNPALLDLFIYFDAHICFTMAFPPLGSSNNDVPVFIDFLSNSQWDVAFHRIVFDYSFANWYGIVII